MVLSRLTKPCPVIKRYSDKYSIIVSVIIDLEPHDNSFFFLNFLFIIRTGIWPRSHLMLRDDEVEDEACLARNMNLTFDKLRLSATLSYSVVIRIASGWTGVCSHNISGITSFCFLLSCGNTPNTCTHIKLCKTRIRFILLLHSWCIAVCTR